MAAEVGDKAPGFTLPTDSWSNEVSLDDFTGDGPVVLFFYPGDWSSVCTDQMEVIEDRLPRFEELGAKVLGISVDSPWSHEAWAHARELTIPLLSDFQREVTRDYGVLREEGFAERAYFVIDGEGRIRAKRVESAPADSPDIETVFEELDKALQ
ncbi:MAG: peroxiredoxin [Rubrobacteraceae bacterium]